jgi:Protein of unknown function (DUF3606)
MAKRPNKEGAPDRSRINMNEAHGVRYWTEALGCSEDELAAAVARVRAIQPMPHSVRFTDIGHMGHSERQKYRDADEEDRASEREPLASSPALRGRRHCSLAGRLVTVWLA